MTTIQKPEHNRFDNIFEIRQTILSQQVNGFLSNLQTHIINQDRVTEIGGALIYCDVKDFIHATLSSKTKLPIWKIVIQRLDGNTGAIYYISESENYNRIFRGTFGYGGTGPHQSAWIESCFEKFNLPFEVRGGDYLLNFCYPKSKEGS